MNSIIDDIDVTKSNDDVVFYDVSKDQDVRLIIGEKYPVNVVEVKTRDVDVKKKYRATVYNLTLEVAPGCKDFKYNNKGEEIDGSPFVGRRLYANGVFKFLEPSLSDSFESNHGGNKGYLDFCESLNVECPTKEVKLDSGETKELRALPSLTDDDILGKPLMGKLIKKTWKDREGQEKTSLIVTNLEKWEGGKPIQVDGLPL